MRIVLEGSDYTGKTTVAKILRLMVTTSDRAPEFSPAIAIDGVDEESLDKYLSSSEDFVFILYAEDDQILSRRLEKDDHPDVYDRDCHAYNRQYRSAIDTFAGRVQSVKIDGKSPFEIASEIIEFCVKKAELPSEPTITGESKTIYRIPDTNLAVVHLKPTLYSFTHNRYGIAPGTDRLRTRFWSLLGCKLNTEFSLRQDHLIVCNYMGVTNSGSSVITYFQEKLPPIEVIWKGFLVGTMKHNLHGVDQYKTREGRRLLYDGKMPRGVVRFDWRNPLPGKDECIPEDFADIYVDTAKARATVVDVTKQLGIIFEKSGYELVDICYFIDESGRIICSEISPDGMRVRRAGGSYDKDLWRAGKDPQVICETWSRLLNDLGG